MIDATPRGVLAVYAHPDDADIGCGGALARWAEAGSAVHLVVCTDGGKGTTDPDVDPKTLVDGATGGAPGLVRPDRADERGQPGLSRR